MKNIVLLLALSLLVTAHAISQTATINIKGFVTDESTSQPVGKDIDMVIMGKNTQKKWIVKVNSKTGEYLQPISSGDSYTITFSSYAVFKKVETLEVPPTSKYREERHDYKVRSIIQGQTIASISAFDVKSSQLSSSSTAEMQQVLDIAKQNRDLNIIIRIAQEQIPPPPPVVTKKDKTASKKQLKPKKGAEVAVVAPVAEVVPQLTDAALYEQRVEALKKYFSEAKNADLRIKYEMGPPQVAAPGQKNITVIVGEVKSILD